MGDEVRLKRDMFPVVGDVVTWDGEGWVAQAPMSRRGVIGLLGIREWIRVSTAMEGPDIDIDAGTVKIGRGGDTILVFDDGGLPVAEHAATSAGLDAATGAAGSGDVIWLPAGTIGGDHVLGTGLHYIGLSRKSCKLSGKITLSNAAVLENVTVQRTANSADELAGVVGPSAGTARIIGTVVACIQAGAGDALGIKTGGDGDIEVWSAELYATSGSGDGYACYHAGAEAGEIYVYGGKMTASTGPVNDDSVKLYSCYLVSSGEDGAPLHGDRAAWDVVSYASEHAADLDAGTPTRHTPLPGAEGQVVRSDGSKWESARLTRSGVAMAWMGC